ncbi:hypothetical protein [Phaffia rhodozyma]|uniref:Uncharacterized protein n=1 Tax=Phaffia rhodozyma TaxID=264483 RepID=A0A0F7SIA2_PHARH|nr:hypothetical protein [Phaffia rhodozyma]
MRATSLLRNAQPINRSIFKRFLDGRNDIIAKQRAFQSEKDTPVYLLGRGKTYFKFYLALLAVSTVASADTGYKLVLGNKDE